MRSRPPDQHIAAIFVLGPALDANYNAVKLAAWGFSKSAKA
jgi:hypothetical protein